MGARRWVVSATLGVLVLGGAAPVFLVPELRAMRRDYLGFTTGLHRQHGDLVGLHIVHERSVDIFHPDLLPLGTRCSYCNHGYVDKHSILH